jgi:hypothetical protein
LSSEEKNLSSGEKNLSSEKKDFTYICIIFYIKYTKEKAYYTYTPNKYIQDQTIAKAK